MINKFIAFFACFIILVVGILLSATTVRSEITIQNAALTDVTPSGFAIIWNTSETATPDIEIFSDIAGTDNITGELEITLFPLQGGDPEIIDEYQREEEMDNLRNLARTLGLMKIAVHGCLPQTTYYYRIYAEGAGEEVVSWPTDILASVTTTKENAFVNDSKQLLVKLVNSEGTLDAMGWMLGVSSSETLFPIFSFVGDGAGFNQAYLNLSHLFGSDGVNWMPTGSKEIFLEIRRPGLSPIYETLLIDFSNNFIVSDVYNIEINIDELIDSDSDGMPDDWELDHFGDLSRDGTGDYDGDGISDLEEYQNETDPTLNETPLSNAGADRNAVTGEPVTLDGSDSYDPEGAMITFLWTFTDVPAASSITDASLSDSNSAKPEFTPDVDGTYTLSLTTNDGVNDSIQDEVLITASVSNVAPNANAGPDRNALTESMVFLDGSRSFDPDNGPQPLSYLWNFNLLPPASGLADIDIIDSDLANASFIPDVNGAYELKLTVNDSDLASEDIVEIISTVSNVPPNADAGNDITIFSNDTAVLDGSASNDPDDWPGQLIFNWRFAAVPDGSGISNSDLFNANTLSPFFTPDVTGTYVSELMISDSEESDFDNVAVTVISRSDLDSDGISDDGDGSGTAGDNPCTGGNTENCDDNCINTPNPNQEDYDNDGIGDVCDNCPDIYPDEPPAIDSVSIDGCLSELCQSDLSASAADQCGGNLNYTWTPLNGGEIIGSGAGVQFDPPDSGPHPCPYQVELTVTSDISGLESTRIIDITIKLAGDADGDGSVDLMDRLLVRQHYGELEGDPNWDSRADVTCDGAVDLMDRLKVRQQYGQIDGCMCQE